MIPRWKVAAPALALALAGCTSALTAQRDNALFETHEIPTPAALHQTVLTGNFDGSGHAQLALVIVDPARSHRVRLIAWDGGSGSRPLTARSIRPSGSWTSSGLRSATD